jgi:hypothetical protein
MWCVLLRIKFGVIMTMDCESSNFDQIDKILRWCLFCFNIKFLVES